MTHSIHLYPAVVSAAENEYPICETTTDENREHMMNQRRQFEKGAVWYEGVLSKLVSSDPVGVLFQNATRHCNDQQLMSLRDKLNGLLAKGVGTDNESIESAAKATFPDAPLMSGVYGARKGFIVGDTNGYARAIKDGLENNIEIEGVKHGLFSMDKTGTKPAGYISADEHVKSVVGVFSDGYNKGFGSVKR